MEDDEFMRRVFDYLSNNLRVNVTCTDSGSYGYGSPGVDVTITLYSPYTGKHEVIASGCDSLKQ
jgi:hypothetical protein